MEICVEQELGERNGNEIGASSFVDSTPRVRKSAAQHSPSEVWRPGVESEVG